MLYNTSRALILTLLLSFFTYFLGNSVTSCATVAVNSSSTIQLHVTIPRCINSGIRRAGFKTYNMYDIKYLKHINIVKLQIMFSSVINKRVLKA